MLFYTTLTLFLTLFIYFDCFYLDYYLFTDLIMWRKKLCNLINYDFSIRKKKSIMIIFFQYESFKSWREDIVWKYAIENYFYEN